ncbi:MAG: hypothetical protein M0Z66_14685 [Thermaerobacter sp.]|nr:hypothetical protein [Thermaerobacter sp.]
MSKRITDAELAELLRSVPEPLVPPMAPPRLPQRPRPLPTLPWRQEDLVLLFAAGGLCLGGAACFAASGPGVLAAYAVQLFVEPGAVGATLLTTLFAATLGWLVVVLATPRPTA